MPLDDSRVSWKSSRPSATPSSVSGLSAGSVTLGNRSVTFHRYPVVPAGRGAAVGEVTATLWKRSWLTSFTEKAPGSRSLILAASESPGRECVEVPSLATTMEAAGPVPVGGAVRVDTGVFEGGEIPMYYDSMIAKLVVHGFDRSDAIRRMREALNGFVIRGVASNIAFQSALLAHPRFVAGDFDTGFIAEQYPQGFRAEDVVHEDPDFLLALAAVTYRRYRERAARITGQLPGHEMRIGDEFVVVVKGAGGIGEHVPVHLRADAAAITVELRGKSYAISEDWTFGGIRAGGSCNGHSFTAQVERDGLWTRVAHNGRRIEAMVMSARASELLRVMPFKPPPDLGKFLLSPMPGLLAQLAVHAGQAVHAGERLAVIEAMKMENVLTATQDGVVKALLAAQGDSLAVDQPIMSFE